MSTDRRSADEHSRALNLSDDERAAERDRIHRHRHRRKHRSSERSDSAPRHLWLHAFDVCLAWALLVPFVLGGRIAHGEFLLVLATFGCALSWAGYQFSQTEPVGRWTRAEVLLAAILGLGLLQVTPLPSALLETLSPSISKVLPLWDGKAESIVGQWKTLSLTVAETRAALVIGMAYVLLFWLTAQRLRSLQDVTRLLKAMAVFAAAMAGFGLLQYLGSNGKYYWCFEYPTVTTADRIKGAFTNKNHFAAYLTLAIGPMISWLMGVLDTDESDEAIFGRSGGTPLPRSVRLALVSFAGALIAVAIASSLSRGAVVAGASGVAAVLLVMYLKSLISLRLAIAFAGVGLVAGGLQFAFGYEQMMNRLDRWDDNGRMQIWQANLEASKDFRLLGSGVGSHRYIHLRYLDKVYDDHEYSHAESNYLQVLTETGVVGLSLALACLLVCTVWCWRSLRRSPSKLHSMATLAVVVSLIASCVQSVFDFTWYVPGYMVVLILQMACACRLSQLASSGSEATIAAPEVEPAATTRLVKQSFNLLAVLMGLWMIKTSLPFLRAEGHWLEYRRLTFNTDTEEKSGADEGLSEAERAERKQNLLVQKIVTLRAAAKANPQDPRFQMRLARHYQTLLQRLQQFSENQMPLNQIRDAALANFESRDEMLEWVSRNLGTNFKLARAAAKHSLRSIRLNPIEFHAYLDFTELAFLEGGNAEFESRCLAQALAIAPHDGQVLYLAGREAWARSEPERAFELWKRAFHRNQAAQAQILRILIGAGVGIRSEEDLAQNPELANLPTQTDILVKLFEPDTASLMLIADIQHAMESRDEERRTLQMLAAQLTEKARAEGNYTRLNDWIKVAQIYGRLEQPDKVEESFREAILANPTSYLARFEFGAWLYNQRRGTEALEQFRTCQRMNPNDHRVARLVERLQRGQVPGLIQQAEALAPQRQ